MRELQATVRGSFEGERLCRSIVHGIKRDEEDEDESERASGFPSFFLVGSGVSFELGRRRSSLSACLEWRERHKMRTIRKYAVLVSPWKSFSGQWTVSGSFS